jgi:hypothetical protein
MVETQRSISEWATKMFWVVALITLAADVPTRKYASYWMRFSRMIITPGRTGRDRRHFYRAVSAGGAARCRLSTR